MKILILVMILTNPEKTIIGQDYLQRNVDIVQSTESAAIVVYKLNHNKNMFDHWDSKLYEINLTTKEIKEIQIPKIGFSQSQ